MNIYDLRRVIIETAKKCPLVQTIVPTTDELNTLTDLVYGVFICEMGTLDTDTRGWVTANLNLFYVDRIKDVRTDNGSERKEDNSNEIQARGVAILENLIRTLPGDVGVQGTNYSLFTHRFLDQCAGVIASVTFRFPWSICWDDFEPAPEVEGYLLLEQIWRNPYLWRDNDICVWTEQVDNNAVEFIMDSADNLGDIMNEPWQGKRGSWIEAGLKAKLATIPTKTSDLLNDSGFITNAVNNLINYYSKALTYTKSEVDYLISQIQGIHFEIVTILPEVGSVNVVYLVPNVGTTGYTQYIWTQVEGVYQYVAIGGGDIDLSEYAKKSWVEEKGYQTAADVANIVESYGYATESWVSQEISVFLTEQQIRALIEGYGYTTMSAVEAKGYQTSEQVETAITSKGYVTKSVNDLENYYTKNVTYTQAEVDALIAAVPTFRTLVVSELPETGESNVMYLVPSSSPTLHNNYVEYLWVNNQWEIVGGNAFYILSFSGDEHGSVIGTVDGTPVTSPTIVNAGSTVVLTAIGNEGYGFSQWSDGSNANPREFIISGNVYLTATFAEHYEVIFSCEHGSVGATVDGVGIQSGSYVLKNKTVVFTITPDSGYEYWGTNPESVVVTSALTKEYECTPEFVWDGLTLVSDGTSSIFLNKVGSANPNMEYTFDGINWTTLSGSVSFTKIHLRGTNSSISPSSSSYAYFSMGGDNVRARGSIMSLLDGVGESTTLESNYAFYRLFFNCTNLVTPPSLPATTVTSSCYEYMFFGCTGLTSVPSLPAMTVQSYSYDHMFNGCTSLVNAMSSLPATSLGGFCYGSMFRNCTSLVNAPSLPATTLAPSCYSSMFNGCESLVTAPTLPATSVVYNCYDMMFYNCDSLTGPVTIAATTPYSSGTTTACSDMFKYSGTNAGAGGTIYVGDNAALWNVANAGISTPPWNVYARYTLTFSAVNGSVDVSSFTGVTGESVTVTVTPNYHTHFTQWSDGDTNNPRTFTIGTQSVDYTGTCEVDSKNTLSTGTFNNCYVASLLVNNVPKSMPVEVWADDTITLRVSPDPGYEVTSSTWSFSNPPSSVEYYTNTIRFSLDNGSSSVGCIATPATAWTGLKITANEDTDVQFTQVGTWSGTWDIEYSYDGSTWMSYIMGLQLHLTAGTYVCWRGTKDSTAQSDSVYRRFVFSGSVSASGDCTSLLNGTGGVSDLTPYGSYTFARLFNECVTLISGPSLPSTTLVDECYLGMFARCSAFTSAPSLPASVMTEYCYAYMFYYCEALVNAPTLPATTLDDHCYEAMFQSTGLVTAPALPATTLAEGCYLHMMTSCHSLVNAPTLSATTLATGCYNNMFSDCTSLKRTPELPATQLADTCYAYMFLGCTSLEHASELPATTLMYSCYSNMFEGCTSLVNAPSIAATTLANECCERMFYDCTSLITGPDLKSTSISGKTDAYKEMFRNCEKLTGPFYLRLDSPYVTTGQSGCTAMFYGTGSGEGAGGTVYVGNNPSYFTYTNTGISGTYWTVIKITDEESNE